MKTDDYPKLKDQYDGTREPTPINLDNLIGINNKTQYDRNWQNRCNSCLAPCCHLSMSGFAYDNTPIKEFDEMRSMFNHDFVIIKSKEFETSWKSQLGDQDHTKLLLCPLNIYSKCLIYEDRPKMCKKWKCVMKVVEGTSHK